MTAASHSHKRVFITGGAGFIGSHLAQLLLDRGHRVSILDDLSTGSLENLEPVRAHKNLVFCRGSIFDEPLLGEMIGNCDAVVHLAASVGVRLIVTDPVYTIENNIHGTELVLKHVAARGVRTLVASSSEVYGKGSRIPFSEDDDLILGPTTKGRWSYACSKAIDEFLALAYHKQQKLPVTLLRLFNTVGPRQTGRYGMVIPRFAASALNGTPIEVYGTGTQSRCFSNVRDVVEVFAALLDCPASHGQVFNVGGTEEISILDLARRIKALAESSSEIRFIPYHEAMEEGFEDMQRRVPDVAKLKRVIPFAPRFDLDATLRQVIEHLRPRLRREPAN